MHAPAPSLWNAVDALSPLFSKSLWATQFFDTLWRLSLSGELRASSPLSLHLTHFLRIKNRICIW